jgi:hypothetical protein
LERQSLSNSSDPHPRSLGIVGLQPIEGPRPFVIVLRGTQGLAARFTEADDAKAILPQRRNEGILSSHAALVCSVNK